VTAIRSLDHLVLTVRDLAATIAFYERLGLQHEEFAPGRHALRFGTQKLNLHVVGHELEPHAALPTPGSADLCFLVDRLDLDALDVELGPVDRAGAAGRLRSVYVRDPDGNLVELSTVTG
jgi:catechol 2,3-dioxygenase-like lactoylglutathione lyase family enzyme